MSVLQPENKPPFFTKLIRNVMVVWLLLSMVYFAIYMVAVEFAWHFVYYYIWLIVFGLPLWVFRNPISAALKKWQGIGRLKFFVLAYGMVILEEIFAALFNHLGEGFNLSLYLLRVGQFWAFNILAFTGLIFATWLLFTRIQYSIGEMFFLVGLTGLYSEKIINLLPASPQVFAVFAPLTLFTYGLIVSPALMSANLPPRRALPFLLRFVLLILAWYLFSVPPVGLLMILRTNFPILFPPCEFISCS